MNTIDLFHKYNLPYQKLESNLYSKSREEFKKAFINYFTQDSAKKFFNVVYIWSTEKEMPRLCGSSDILYIGKTLQSLHNRYRYKTKDETDEATWCRYSYIFDNFGSITIAYTKSFPDPKRLKKIEADFLNAYFEKHLEYPPFNNRTEYSS